MIKVPVIIERIGGISGKRIFVRRIKSIFFVIYDRCEAYNLKEQVNVSFDLGLTDTLNAKSPEIVEKALYFLQCHRKNEFCLIEFENDKINSIKVLDIVALYNGEEAIIGWAKRNKRDNFILRTNTPEVIDTIEKLYLKSVEEKA